LTLRHLGPTFIGAMPSAGETHNPPLRPSVFLSYASEDRPAASLIRDALAAAGLEVWFDEEVLAGGDAWDRKIRRQIRDCDYFMPVISAQTEGRHEGYFRREWRLAVERTLDMADDHTFLLPVAIDATDQASARVPEKFLAVQWLKLPGGQPTPALEALCSRLIAGEPTEMLGAHRRTRARPRSEGRPQPAPRVSPAFPTEEPGQRVKFWFGVAGWALRSAWVFFQRFPRWFRLIIYVWIAFLALSRGCSRGPRQPEATPTISPETAEKLKAIAGTYQGTSNKGDIAKLGLGIAREFSGDASENAKETSPLLAIPFLAPADSPADAKLADSTFALLYGRISISHQGRVGLSKEPLPSLDVGGAVARGRESHSSYVLYGGIEDRGGARVLTVDVVAVPDGSVVWSKSYPVANADPAAIAPEVESRLPSLDEK
jgi:hypothetical protein